MSNLRIGARGEETPTRAPFAFSVWFSRFIGNTLRGLLSVRLSPPPVLGRTLSKFPLNFWCVQFIACCVTPRPKGVTYRGDPTRVHSTPRGVGVVYAQVVRGGAHLPLSPPLHLFRRFSRSVGNTLRGRDCYKESMNRLLHAAPNKEGEPSSPLPPLLPFRRFPRFIGDTKKGVFMRPFGAVVYSGGGRCTTALLLAYFRFYK